MTPTFWRGPFVVVRVRRRWVIVNVNGDVERRGFRLKAEAETVCRTMNQSAPVTNVAPSEESDGR